MKQLVLATRNQHKVRELQNLLGGFDLKILTMEDFPSIGEVVEDQDTIEGNAWKKAQEVFRQANLPTLADDTGLEVYYLNGAPGVFSARYAGPKASYHDNCKKLLSAMRGVPARRRNAQFRCVLAFAATDVDRIVEGTVFGSIIETPRGSAGFGYDPIFLPAGHSETLAEMSFAKKNEVSHRALALQAMKPILLEYFGRG